MSETIHPTAVVHRATRIDETVTIGPYAVIEDGVELGSHTIVGPHALIQSGTVTGERCQIGAHAVVGGLPQDLRFDPRTPSGVRLGDGVVLREGVTVNRASKEGAFTEIGTEAFLMACAHVGHDSVVGDHAILANNVMLGGHVEVGAHAFLGGAAAVHQFVRIGESAMVGGVARVTRDVPPFTIMAERDELVGLNLIGLRRRQLGREEIRALKQAYRAVCGPGGQMRERAARYLAAQASLPERVRRFLEFFASGKRGFIQPEIRSAAQVAEATEDKA
ncbi:MAG: acyl-ACP--UDP-N-acetylglucosamine O-acyltransferase [Opitutales bacterium]